MYGPLSATNMPLTKSVVYCVCRKFVVPLFVRASACPKFQLYVGPALTGELQVTAARVAWLDRTSARRAAHRAKPDLARERLGIDISHLMHVTDGRRSPIRRIAGRGRHPLPDQLPISGLTAIRPVLHSLNRFAK